MINSVSRWCWCFDHTAHTKYNKILNCITAIEKSCFCCCYFYNSIGVWPSTCWLSFFSFQSFIDSLSLCPYYPAAKPELDTYHLKFFKVEKCAHLHPSTSLFDCRSYCSLQDKIVNQLPCFKFAFLSFFLFSFFTLTLALTACAFVTFVVLSNGP